MIDLSADAWIPTIVDGHARHLTIAEALPLSLRALDCRPEFSFAVLLILIGASVTGYDLSKPLLQSPSARDGNELPVRSLLFDEPSANAFRNGMAYHSWWGIHHRQALCESCATLALYCKQLFGGPGGPGLFPGPLFHSSLYLHVGETVAETVALNTHPGAHVASYFAASKLYQLGDSEDGECAVCGHQGAVVKTVFRYPHRSYEGPEVPSPHAAETRAGKRYAIRPNDTIIDIMNGAAPDSLVSIQSS